MDTLSSFCSARRVALFAACAAAACSTGSANASTASLAAIPTTALSGAPASSGAIRRIPALRRTKSYSSFRIDGGHEFTHGLHTSQSSDCLPAGARSSLELRGGNSPEGERKQL
ncbi:hypothetical protein T484DRAFT_1754606 [Baffinella frigidus]|nr:hypothetical protein T484DRAFT_1754606 [Cryptophyta sp. CCMP2293]